MPPWEGTPGATLERACIMQHIRTDDWQLEDVSVLAISHIYTNSLQVKGFVL